MKKETTNSQKQRKVERDCCCCCEHFVVIALGGDNDGAGVAELVWYGGVGEEGEVDATEGGEEGRGDTVVGDVEGALLAAGVYEGISIEVEGESKSEIGK